MAAFAADDVIQFTAEAVTTTKALGAIVHVLVAGKDCKGAADAAAKLDGVEKVLVADAAPYEHQLAEPLAALIVSMAGRTHDAIVAPATTTGKNVMPRVAALLDVMQISDVAKIIGFADMVRASDLRRQCNSDREVVRCQKGHHRTHLDLSGQWALAVPPARGESPRRPPIGPRLSAASRCENPTA